jgi:hypothetical protein
VTEQGNKSDEQGDKSGEQGIKSVEQGRLSATLADGSHRHPLEARHPRRRIEVAAGDRRDAVEVEHRRKITKREPIFTQMVGGRSARHQDAVRPDEGARAEGRHAGVDDAGDTAWTEWAAVLYHDFASFVARSFREVNPRTPLAMNWHFELVAGKLAAVREVRIRRLIVSLPPRHLKSHLASIAFPAWCLGHDPSAQILCVTPGFTPGQVRG